MKYATFVIPDSPREPKLGAVLGAAVIDLHAAQSWAQGARGLPPEPLPNSVFELIHAGQPAWLYARNLVNVLDGVDATANGNFSGSENCVGNGRQLGPDPVLRLVRFEMNHARRGTETS